MTTLLPPGKQQFSDANGVPLAGGSVFMYVPGTTTFKNTWQDGSQVTLNTNPVILDAAGEAVIFGLGAYRQIVQDSLGNTIWDQLTSSTDQGGIYSGGVSTGTAANQIVAVTVPAGFALVAGNQLTFIAGFTSTGATTLNANGTGAKNILKPGIAGPVALAAGDIVVGNAVEVFYDGTQYQMMSSVPVSVGAGLTTLAGVIVTNELVNAQTGTTYAIVIGDRAKLVTRTNAAAMADTLPNANTLGTGGWYVDISVLPASVGGLTITPTTSTIDGAATLVLTPAQGARIVSDGTNYFTERGMGRLPQVVVLQDQKAVGSNGDAFTLTTWTKRTITTKVLDTGGICTLASSTFTLPSGTYDLEASMCLFAPSSSSEGMHRLRNTTDGVTTLQGTNSGAGGGVITNTPSVFSGRFTITGTKTFQFEGFTDGSGAIMGGAMGSSPSPLELNIYLNCKITKVA